MNGDQEVRYGKSGYGCSCEVFNDVVKVKTAKNSEQPSPLITLGNQVRVQVIKDHNIFSVYGVSPA